MHELPTTAEVLRVVLVHAAREGAHRVHRILLVVSELSDLQPLWIQRYFDQVAAGTAAEGARLEIESQAPEFTCRSCDAVFQVSLRMVDRVACPRCGNTGCTLTKLPDYVVEEIEVS